MPVSKRGNGYQAVVNNKYERYRKQFNNEHDAEMWCLEMRKALRNGDPIGHLIEDQNASPAASRAAKSYRLDKVLDNTYKMFWADKTSARDARRKISELLDFFGHNANVKDVTTLSMDDFVIQCKGKGNSGATCNRKLAVLSKALKYAVEREIIPKKPTVPFQEESEGLTVFVEPEQERKFLDTLTHWGDRFMLDTYTVLVDTGLRKGEFLKIRKKHITESGMLKIGYDYRTKNGKPRTIALTDRSLTILKRRGEKLKGSDLLFDVSVNTLDRRWQRIRGALGFNDIKIHTLRHTTASRLAQKGVSLQAIMKWMGHGDITTAMRYQHLCPDNMIGAKKILDKMILSIEEPSQVA